MTVNADNQIVNIDIQGKFNACQRHTLELCANLSVEDCQIQSMEDASPIKWHLAHTAWAVEVFFLSEVVTDYKYVNEQYIHMFNSYYHGVGEQYLRKNRSLLSRPSFDEVVDYRNIINQRVSEFLGFSQLSEEQTSILELVIQHEKQHQELMMMDIKHAFYQNPLQPKVNNKSNTYTPVSPLSFIQFNPELTTIGTNDTHFSFDNERPEHKTYINSFKLANRLITNGEYLEFIQAGGYRDSLLWLSDGWFYIQKNQITRPLYWNQKNGVWSVFTLQGEQTLDLDQPVCHVSYYEAQAFASWKNCRLATEFEWEYASQTDLCSQMIGSHWQWTSSNYSPYPGFKPYDGIVSEYNGKFMSSQFVLRGGCVVSPDDHIRSTYRNFFYPQQNWMFSSIRLAQD